MSTEMQTRAPPWRTWVNFTTVQPMQPARPSHLLHLELDCGLHFINFGHHVLIVGQQGRELAGLIQAWAQDSWDLLDQRL